MLTRFPTFNGLPRDHELALTSLQHLLTHTYKSYEVQETFIDASSSFYPVPFSDSIGLKILGAGVYPLSRATLLQSCKLVGISHQVLERLSKPTVLSVLQEILPSGQEPLMCVVEEQVAFLGPPSASWFPAYMVVEALADTIPDLLRDSDQDFVLNSFGFRAKIDIYQLFPTGDRSLYVRYRSNQFPQLHITMSQHESACTQAVPLNLESRVFVSSSKRSAEVNINLLRKALRNLREQQISGPCSHALSQ